MIKYAPEESWGDAFEISTATHRRVAEYSGYDFAAQCDLPYSAFLLLVRDSWLDSYMRSDEGRQILKDISRLQQTKADISAIREMIGGENAKRGLRACAIGDEFACEH